MCVAIGARRTTIRWMAAQGSSDRLAAVRRVRRDRSVSSIRARPAAAVPVDGRPYWWGYPQTTTTSLVRPPWVPSSTQHGERSARYSVRPDFALVTAWRGVWLSRRGGDKCTAFLYSYPNHSSDCVCATGRLCLSAKYFSVFVIPCGGIVFHSRAACVNFFSIFRFARQVFLIISTSVLQLVK